MNVSDMINLMSTLGIGENMEEADAQVIALQYLNLAHAQLYRETANVNANILINEMLSNIANQSYITLAETPFIIAKIFPVGQIAPLKGMSVLNFAQYKFENSTLSGTPNIYSFKNNIVNFFPTQGDTVYQFDTWYAPQLTEFNEFTLEADIPYPPEYQQVLVDGALYYLFQDESGFKNPLKETEAKKRWLDGKADLVSYFTGSNKESISTFSNI